jgi:Cu+-exporting ATPase
VTMMITTRLAVQGMVCGACERHVHGALAKVPGVQRVSVSAPDALAIVLYDASRITEDDLVSAVCEAGYGARTASDTLCS